MDLETLIPIIIIAVAYLYKAFEKARKKEDKPGQPASKPVQRPSAPVQKPVARKMPDAARPRPAEQEWWDSEVLDPSPERDQRKHTAPQMQADRMKPERMSPEKTRTGDLINPETSAVNPEEVPEEVRRIRELRRLREQTAVSLPPEPETVHEYADFDLRDAVIKSAILERREF